MDREEIISDLNTLAHADMTKLKLYLVNNEFGFLSSSVNRAKGKIRHFHPEITIETIVELPVITHPWVDEMVSGRDGNIYSKDLSY